MYIPKQFSELIKNAFYDKTVYILGKETVFDAEGGVRSTERKEVDQFCGNVSFSNCERIQKEYGLDCQIDIVITTSTDVPVKIDDRIRYKGITYTVNKLLPFDSHILITAETCLR